MIHILSEPSSILYIWSDADKDVVHAIGNSWQPAAHELFFKIPLSFRAFITAPDDDDDDDDERDGFQ